MCLLKIAWLTYQTKIDKRDHNRQQLTLGLTLGVLEGTLCLSLDVTGSSLDLCIWLYLKL